MRNFVKTFTAFLLIQFAIAGFSTILAQDKISKPKKTETMKCWVSMDCSSCQTKIEKNMSFEKGVSDLKVDLPTKMVTITYKPAKTSPEKLEKALQELGFKTEVIADKK